MFENTVSNFYYYSQRYFNFRKMKKKILFFKLHFCNNNNMTKHFEKKKDVK